MRISKGFVPSTCPDRSTAPLTYQLTTYNRHRHATVTPSRVTRPSSPSPASRGTTAVQLRAQPPTGRGVAETRHMPVSILPRSGAREEGPARPSSKCLSASYGPEAWWRCTPSHPHSTPCLSGWAHGTRPRFEDDVLDTRAPTVRLGNRAGRSSDMFWKANDVTFPTSGSDAAPTAARRSAARPQLRTKPGEDACRRSYPRTRVCRTPRRHGTGQLTV